MKYEVCYGQDVPAYGDLTIEADSDEKAVAEARAAWADERATEIEWDSPQWDLADDGRIVSIKRQDEDGAFAEAIDLEPDPLLDNAHRLLELCRYIDYSIGGDPDEEYADDEVLDIRVTGASVKQIKAAIAACEGRE